MMTSREWTIFWKPSTKDDGLSFLGVDGPLLMPKERITVIERERAEKLFSIVDELVNAITDISNLKGHETSEQSKMLGSSLAKVLKKNR
jgi:hypothetical protein